MTEQEKNIIKKYRSGSISKEDFVENYPKDLSQQYIELVLNEAHGNKNTEDLDNALTLLFFDPELKTTDKYVDILNDLLMEVWHYKHEDLAMMLQSLKSPKSVDVLYRRALANPDYMDYDDTYSLARKCIHALGDINTEYSREKLALLAASEEPIIKEKAQKQLLYKK